ncbi:Rne/Rng family ribonuclease [Aestuariivirga sp. YIM B02566]|uniref:Ribonuclease E/G n=1 Tax=Taklimakanibacter albus TaxID=2800327 RepID=A0ACC5R0J1_9HYPH|nr:ribonuclease E/G [Aestuariivirga sp. YIM B02566]MBK1866133.1 ribonuclease E/G [Aestuariivirga sp. YIM B02566]
MGSKMLIDATHAEETRVVVVRGNRIEEFDFESAARKQLKGNIYLAKVTRVEPSLQAAFVDYGGNRHGFLAFSEIHPDYYQIPVADRQALLREEEEDARHHDDDFHPRHTDSHDDHAESSSSEGAGADASAERHDDDHSDEAMAAAAAAPETLEAEPIAAPQVEHGLPAEIGDGIESVEEDAEAQKVDSVGAEDALEEVPQRRRRSQRRVYKIQEVIKRRQVILVQVVKEERGNKGAALTTYLSLAGRYCVLMPNTARGGGISRKITDSTDRRRLKEVTRDIEVPAGMGLIVRTAGAQRTKTEIKRDFDYLMRLWENVRDLTLSSTAPALVYEEGSLIKRSIRDLYSKDVDDVQVEGDEAYREAKDFMKMLMPSHARNVKLYKDNRPLFSRFQVETQLDSLFSQNVTLPSGGYMVVNQTEALVSIDINSGKATREHNIEDTALKTNLEASDEIARQLRLRDLAGLVVIDFIDMEEKRNNRSVERRLKEALKNDRARIQVGRISHFGLLEMSRQRLRPSLLEGSTRVCPHCEGRGIVRSVSSCALSVMRAIEEHLIGRKSENLTVKCHRDVAAYVLNEKRNHLLDLEATYSISIFIVPSDDVKGSQVLIERAGERAVPQRKTAAPVKIDTAFQDRDEEPEAEDVPEAEEEEERESDAQSERAEHGEQGNGEQGNGDNSRRRRRRRGRRGGRRGQEREHGLNGNGGERDDVPGLGDQPGLEPQAAFDADDEDAEPEAPETIDNEAREPREERTEGGDREARGDRRGRRDRWGRGRRNRNRGDRNGHGEASADHAPGGQEAAAEPREERHREERHREERHEVRFEESAPAPKPIEKPKAEPAPPPAPVEAYQPPKWQPPAPTVAAERPAQAKAGWWSKRG